MAPTLSQIPSDSSTNLAETLTNGNQPELRNPPLAQPNGSSPSINGGERSKNGKNVFTSGTYLFPDDNSMTNLSNSRSAGSTGGMAAKLFPGSSNTNEGHFTIPGPYETNAPKALKEVEFGSDNALDSLPEASTTWSGQQLSLNSNRPELHDPHFFGDDLQDSLTGQPFSSSPPGSIKAGPAPSSRQYQKSLSLNSVPTGQAPPVPSYAPPAIPGTGLSHPPVTRKAPPLTYGQTRPGRAKSESSPPPTPMAAAGLLQPPVQHAHVHRKSSPPAPRADQIPGSPMGPPMPRLQQRHTLQVPQAGVLALHPRDGAYSSGDEGLVKNSSPVSNRRTSMNLIRRHSRHIQSDTQVHEIPQDEDAARRAEAMKQRLAARRRRKEEEDDDRVLVGTRVDQNHQNWVTAYNMLTGIRFTVSRTNAKIRDRDLNEADFAAKHKYAFDVAGTELTPSAKYDFKFKDYAPQVFKELRNIFGIDPADYLVSLTSKILLSELASPGKSKSFFYFSRDYKYIIKTVHHAEHKLLRKILPRYVNHVRNNPNTLLSQFYGLHRIKSPWGTHKTHFVVMNNLFPPHRDIHQTYDLKGSTVGRELKEDELDKNPRGTLKDLNWLKRNQHLAFGPIIKTQFIQQMERDVELLKELGIMDYSLLVGIHDLTKGNMEGLRDKNLRVYQPGGTNEKAEQALNRESMSSGLARTPSSAEKTKAARELRANLRKEKPMPINQAAIDMPDASAADRTSRMFTKDDGGIQAEHENGELGTEIYYLGIIDCLTKYGFVKRLEHFVKGLSNDKNAISAVQPRTYGDRFVQFMKGISKTDEELARDRQQQQMEKPRHSSSFPLGRKSESSARQNSLQPIGSPEMTPSQQQAERKAKTSHENMAAEEHQRTLGTVQSPGLQGEAQTLPILEEVGEGGSTGDMSSKSRSRERAATAVPGSSKTRNVQRDRSPGASSMRRQESSGAQSIPPPTREAPQVPQAAPASHAPVYGGRPPPTPPKEVNAQLPGLETFGERLVEDNA